MNKKTAKDTLKLLAQSHGAPLFGVCRIDSLHENFHAELQDVSAALNTAISIGVPVSASVLDSIIDHPTVLYKTHYRQINHTLNDIAFLISSQIENSGFHAIPIPASQIISWKPMRAHLSHREIAYKAGLGWWGRNNLLVNRKYGSQVRLVTVLTDLELQPDSPTDDDCGDCYDCLKSCPAGAIFKDKKDFRLDRCYRLVSEFARPKRIGTLICGLCLKACKGDKSISAAL